MGPPNVYSKYDEDLCCPVCKQPLSSPPTPAKTKPQKTMTRGKMRPMPHLYGNPVHPRRDKENRAAVMPLKTAKDHDDVCVAQCGHIFHKFCLRHYCYLFREGRVNHYNKVTCPVCQRSISMSATQTVLYREHQDMITDFDKEGTRTTLMNNELMDQMKSAKEKLVNVEKNHEESKQNLEIYRSHCKRLKKEMKQTKSKKADIDNLYSEIQRTDKILSFMQTQHLKIVRKFIKKVKEKCPKDYIHFPRRLSPYLDMIFEDDRLVRDLGEVIMPIHLNHLKSDRQSLLKGIVDRVAERTKAKEAKEKEQNEKKVDPIVTVGKLKADKLFQHHNPFPNSKRPPIFVKVRKSSVSILSSTSLTRESIQKIIETVQAQAPNDALKNGFPKRKCAFSNNRVDAVSASDIKIIYMPKRKMVEPMSEPCRAIEPSDSCFIKVPPRRCRSTEAVLEKQKKKKKKDAGKDIPGQSGRMDVHLYRKRSKSVEAVYLKEVTPKTMNTCAERKPSAVIAIVSLPGLKTEEEKDVLEKLEESCLDENNNIIMENQEDIKSPKEIETISARDDVKEKISVLEMIYDDLEEERASNQNLEKIHSKTWKTLDENKNEVGLDSGTTRKDVSNLDDTPSSTSCGRPPPQFFRVDRRGNVRPESPFRMYFRQPTFLNSVTDVMTERSTFMTCCNEPDIENQLSALSSEDRYLLAAEQEAIASGRGNKTEMLFELPACLGFPPENPTFEASSNRSIPVYLRRWQEQLPSKKIFNEDSKQELFTSVGHCRSARFEGSGRNFRPRLGLQLRGSQCKRTKGNYNNIHLPPLYMFPVKRPSTADCIRARVRENRMCGGGRGRSGMDSLPRINDFASLFTNKAFRDDGKK